jgi:hypothetical protein
MNINLIMTKTVNHVHNTNVVSLHPANGKVYSIQHYVIKFVSDLQQVGGFFWVFLFPSPIKLATTIIEILFRQTRTKSL